MVETHLLVEHIAAQGRKHASNALLSGLLLRLLLSHRAIRQIFLGTTLAKNVAWILRGEAL